MKKIALIIILLVLGMNICLAEDTVSDSIDDDNVFTDDTPAAEQLNGYVEYNAPEEENAIYLTEPININNINITAPKKIGSKSLVPETKRPTFEPMGKTLEATSKFNTDEYNIRPVSTSYSQKMGKFSFGTTFDSSLSSARVSNSTGFFAKYDGKHVALTGMYSKSGNNYSTSYDDNFIVAPEWKITKRLSLLDVMQTDIYQIGKSNQVVLRYTPHLKRYADDVQFEIGAGQSFNYDSYTSSKIRFSTRFKL